MIAELIHPLDLGLLYNNTPENTLLTAEEIRERAANKIDDLIEYQGRLLYQTTRVPPSAEALRSISR